MFNVENGIVEEVKPDDAVDSQLRRTNLLRHLNTNDRQTEEYNDFLGSESRDSRALPQSMTYVFFIPETTSAKH